MAVIERLQRDWIVTFVERPFHITGGGTGRYPPPVARIVVNVALLVRAAALEHDLTILPVINKIDLLPYIPFDIEYFLQGVEILNPGLTTFQLSCQTGEGVDAWVNWVKQQIKTK